MRIAYSCLGLLTMMLWATTGSAADVNELKRPPVKEPVYQSNQVEYFLLAFGPQSTMRVWVVRDGDTWYIDRNEDGDLTESDKRITVKNGYFTDPVEIKAGNATYKITHFNPHSPDYYIAVETEGKYQQYASAKSASNPKEARLVHFDGPLVMGLAYTDPAKQSIERRSKAFNFSVLIATTDPARSDPWGPVIENRKLVPLDAHPIAEFEFASKKAGGEPIKMKVVLNERC